jgi:hypothetical protein
MIYVERGIMKYKMAIPEAHFLGRPPVRITDGIYTYYGLSLIKGLYPSLGDVIGSISVIPPDLGNRMRFD